MTETKLGRAMTVQSLRAPHDPLLGEIDHERTADVSQVPPQLQPSPVLRQVRRCGCNQQAGPLVAHEHVDRVTVYFDDGREPVTFEDAAYTLWNGGLTVFKDGGVHRFEQARAVADKLAVSRA